MKTITEVYNLISRLKEEYPKTVAFTDIPHIAYEAATMIETLLRRIEDLEWENKGIEEWQQAWIAMKNQRDELRMKLNGEKMLNDRLALIEEEIGKMKQKAAEIYLKCSMDTKPDYTEYDETLNNLYKLFEDRTNILSILHSDSK